MSELKTCLNCGHAVSTSAVRCVNCGSSNPFGSDCAICGQLVLDKDAVPTTLLGFWFRQHIACVDTVLPNFRPNCHVCGADLRRPGADRLAALSEFCMEARRPVHSEYGEPTRAPCPCCGELAPFGRIEQCTKCGVPVPESDLDVRIVTDEWNRSQTQYFHNKCVPPRDASVEARQQLRRDKASWQLALEWAFRGPLLGAVVIGFGGWWSCVATAPPP